MQEKQTNSDFQVKLKPIFGIRPGVYLTFLYSFILLVIVFFLFLYPGLKNPGAVLIVKTEPAGAAVRINGVYRGIAGSKIPVQKGFHIIEAVMPGFESQSAEHEIHARFFGSLFFPLREKIEFTLKLTDPASAFAVYASDYAAWTFAGEPTASWQIPLSLSEGAYRTGNFKGSSDEIQQILLAASNFAGTKAAMRDLIRAKILLDNSGGAPSPAALISCESSILTFLSETQESAKWLSKTLPHEQAAIIEASAWYKKQSAAPPKPQTGSPSGNLQISGLNFIIFSSFMISESPVPATLFETFLNNNPEWREDQTDYFPQEISSYPWEMDKNNITGVTWYAAQEFCKWMTANLPPSMSGMEARLPSEDEWSTAAAAISGMRSQGWEWCADFYTHFQFASASPQAKQLVGSPERSLRGRASSSSPETRASLPPDLSSPIVTFRVVIAPVMTSE